MSVEYTWTYGPMKVEKLNGYNDVVTEICWTCTARDSQRSDSITGMDSGAFSLPDPDPNNYILLSQLSEADVNNWFNQGFNKSTVESRVLEILEQQLEPQVYLAPLPDA